MTRSSSESESEADGGDFLDLDSYLNKAPAQHAKDQLVVDAGKPGLTVGGPASGDSSTSSASGQKKFSHDSGQSYSNHHHHKRKKVNGSTTEKNTRRVTCSESSHTRNSKPYTNHTELRSRIHSRAHSIITEQSSKYTSKRKRLASERRHPTITDLSTGSYSSKYRSDISMDKIIMSTLEELYRLLAERRALPTNLRQKFSGSTTISEVTQAYTAHTRQSKLRKGSERGRTETGVTGRGGECIVAYALNDIPRGPKVADESKVRDINKVSQEEVMPGGFHLDDPVRLYQQAKQLPIPFKDRPSSSSSPDSTTTSRSRKGDSHAPTLCALCRHYWRVARRYLAASTGGVEELIIREPPEFRNKTFMAHLNEMPWSESLLTEQIEKTLYKGMHMTFCKKRDDNWGAPIQIQNYPNYTELTSNETAEKSCNYKSVRLPAVTKSASGLRISVVSAILVLCVTIVGAR